MATTACSIFNVLTVLAIISSIAHLSYFVSSSAAQSNYHGPSTFQNADVEVVYEWNLINFTWPSEEAFGVAVALGDYVPENVAISGVKTYQGESITVHSQILFRFVVHPSIREFYTEGSQLESTPQHIFCSESKGNSIFYL